MNTSPEHIDDLIASYLAGEATEGEIAFVDQWRSKSESNHRYFEQMRLIFEKAAATVTAEQFDTDQAWQKVREKLPARAKTVSFNEGSAGYSFLKIAAGIVLLIAAGIFAWQVFSDDSGRSVEVLSEGSTVADTLPDGSGVFLNRQTRIAYDFDRKSDTHTAKLEGEAYFNINHDSDKTFIVEVGGTFIKDIGTSFNVKAYPGSPTVEVVVEEGEVIFYTADDPGISLKANGKGTYNKQTGKFSVSEPELNVTAYKTKSFIFNDHTLEAVIGTLNSVYATRVQIDDNLKNCRLTVSFNDENIEEIAQIIAETLGLSVLKTDSVIRLKGSACGEGQP